MTTKETNLPLGTQLDKYRITEILGQGGFGITYLATDTLLKHQVAIKEYFPTEMGVRDHDRVSIHAITNRAKDFQYGLEKFLEEGRTLVQFKHPNIVRVSNFLKLNGTAYLIMDYEKGEDLSDYLIRTGFKGGMPETELKSYLVPILKGLQAVHEKGLLHRDVKPGNIYLRKGGEPMLIDFGAARYALGEHSKSMSAIISIGYAPPEQYSSKSKQSPASDLYAWGATAYELITGKPPVESTERSYAIFEDEPDPLKPLSQTHKGKYSSTLLSVIDQCLNIPQKKRPQSAAEVLAMLTGEKQSTGTVKVNPKDRFKNNRQQNQQENRKQSAFNRHHSKGAKPTKESPSSSVIIKYATLLILLATFGVSGYYYYQEHKALSEQQRQAMLIAEKEEKKTWEEALLVNSISIYQAYLDQYPNGKYSDNAEGKIKLLNEKKALVIEIQKLLSELDYSIDLSGVSDTQTENNIREFEKSLGITPKGIASTFVLEKLQVAKRKREEEKLKAKQEEEKIKQLILAIQKELIRLKYKDQHLNGLWDQITKQRILYYQKLKDLEQTGVPSQTLLTTLSNESAWPKEFVCKMVPVYETRSKKADSYFVEASHRSSCPQRGACDPDLLCNHAEEYAEKKLKKECDRGEKLVRDFYDCSSSNSSSARVEAEGYCQEKDPGTERVRVGEKEECTKI
ncbi:MAG: serine/threonine-protein kinase [Marinicella sp.]